MIYSIGIWVFGIGIGFSQVTRPEAATTTTANPVAGTTSKVSRMIDEELYEAYVVSRSDNFKTTLKGRDPFGNVQDLKSKAANQNRVVDAVTAPVVRAVPLAEVVKRLKINMTRASEKKIVIGSTEHLQGERLKVTVKGKLLTLVLTEVTADHLSFHCVETGEIAIRSLAQPPAGMSPPSAQATPRGMSSSNQAAPIEISVDESAP